MSVIPAQVQQLPGHEWSYDNNPNAFEAVLSGVGSFMKAQASLNEEREKRKSTEMTQAFAALIKAGMVDVGPSPEQGGNQFTYGGQLFHSIPRADRANSMDLDALADLALINQRNAATDLSKAKLGNVGMESEYMSERNKKLMQETGTLPGNVDQMRDKYIGAFAQSPEVLSALLEKGPVGAADFLVSVSDEIIKRKGALSQQVAANNQAPAKKQEVYTTPSKPGAIVSGGSKRDKVRQWLKENNYADSEDNIKKVLEKYSDQF